MNYNEMFNNKVYLSGNVAGEAVYSHEIMGEGFYEIQLAVKRLSGQDDLIPLTVSERLMNEHLFVDGEMLTVEGQFRSYNKLEEGKSRLMLTVFVREILENDSEHNPNIIELTGYVCKKPNYRTTPFKREICDLLLAVNRAYNKSDYIPCIAWGRNARFAEKFEIGERIYVSGRIQSRNYQKNVDGEMISRVAFEVSINKIDNLVAEEATEEISG